MASLLFRSKEEEQRSAEQQESQQSHDGPERHAMTDGSGVEIGRSRRGGIGGGRGGGSGAEKLVGGVDMSELLLRVQAQLFVAGKVFRIPGVSPILVRLFQLGFRTACLEAEHLIRF